MMSMITATTTLTINAAFLQEIKEDNVQLRRVWEQLHGELDRPRPFHVSARWLNGLLTELRDQLAIHFSLEETYGYFEDAVSAAPHLSMRADQLQAEHEQLFCRICELVELSERLVYGECSRSEAKVLVDECLAFHEQFCQHEHEENELIMQAFEEDIGVGD